MGFISDYPGTATDLAQALGAAGQGFGSLISAIRNRNQNAQGQQFLQALREQPTAQEITAGTPFLQQQARQQLTPTTTLGDLLQAQGEPVVPEVGAPLGQFGLPVTETLTPAQGLARSGGTTEQLQKLIGIGANQNIDVFQPVTARPSRPNATLAQLEALGRVVAADPAQLPQEFQAEAQAALQLPTEQDRYVALGRLLQEAMIRGRPGEFEKLVRNKGLLGTSGAQQPQEPLTPQDQQFLGDFDKLLNQFVGGGRQ